MNSLCQRLNLTSLPDQLPVLVEAARQHQLSYEAFLQSVLMAELTERQHRAQARRLRAAQLPFSARLEHFDFRFQPSVSERLIRELASLAFLERATNVVLLGPPGVGKPTWRAGWRYRRWKPAIVPCS
ncbi:MAG: ATP-binding protein [Kouleothrix sp.]|nr:ATP-binding protein [Kouleothrix sp.]